MSFALLVFFIFAIFFVIGIWLHDTISKSAKEKKLSISKLEQSNRELRGLNAELTHEIVLLRQAIAFNLPMPSIEAYEKEQDRIKLTIEQSLKDNNGSQE